MMSYEEFFRERQEARYGGAASAAAAASGRSLVFAGCTSEMRARQRIGRASDAVLARTLCKRTRLRLLLLFHPQ